MNDLLIREDIFKYPHAIREHAVRSEYAEVSYKDGATYKHICAENQPDLRGLLRDLMDHEVDISEKFFRMDLEEELPHNVCHADTIASEYAALIYLSDPRDAPHHSGTAFWRHRLYGLHGMPTEEQSQSLGIDHEQLCLRLQQDWTSPDMWELTLHVSCQYNRLLVYPTRRFHSRFPFQGSGTGRGNGRIVHISFFDFAQDPVCGQESNSGNGSSEASSKLLRRGESGWEAMSKVVDGGLGDDSKQE